MSAAADLHSVPVPSPNNRDSPHFRKQPRKRGQSLTTPNDEDLGGTPGPVLVKQYNDGIKELKKRASRGDGPRLENAPDMSQ